MMHKLTFDTFKTLIFFNYSLEIVIRETRQHRSTFWKNQSFDVVFNYFCQMTTILGFLDHE